MPESKEKGNLEKCAREVWEHIGYVDFVYGPELKEGDCRERLATALSAQKKVVEKIKAIKELAEKTNNQELLALLQEEFGYGLLVGH